MEDDKWTMYYQKPGTTQHAPANGWHSHNTFNTQPGGQNSHQKLLTAR